MLRRSSSTRRLSLEPLEGRAVLSTIVPLAEPVEAISHGVSALAWARVDGVSSLESGSLAGAAVNRGATIADDVVVDGHIITGQNFDGGDRLLASAASTGHAGGVNVLLGDGSVRFVKTSLGMLDVLAGAVSTGHIGGANFVLGDGSVRFISDSVAATSLAAEGEAPIERPANFPTFKSIDIESTDSDVLRGSISYTGLEQTSSSGSTGGGMGKVQMQDFLSAGFLAFEDFTGGVSVAASDVIFGSLGQDGIDRSGAGGHELGHVLGLRHDFDATFADAAFASLSESESITRSDPDNNHGTHVAGTIGATGSVGWVKISPDA